MRFAQDHDMIQAFSSDRTNQALDVSILPGRSRCRWSVADAHGGEASCYGMTIRGVSVSDQVLGRLLPREASVIWRAIQSAVGLAVTLVHTRWRRWSRMITKP